MIGLSFTKEFETSPNLQLPAVTYTQWRSVTGVLIDFDYRSALFIQPSVRTMSLIVTSQHRITGIAAEILLAGGVYLKTDSHFF